jgi:hypothetical protein
VRLRVALYPEPCTGACALGKAPEVAQPPGNPIRCAIVVHFQRPTIRPAIPLKAQPAVALNNTVGQRKTRMEPSRTSGTFFAVSLIFFYGLAIALAYAILIAVPRVAAEYVDFGATIPLPTKACIRFAAFIRNGFIVFGPLYGAVLAVSFFLLKERKKRVLVAFPMAAAIALLGVFASMILPVFFK